MTHPFFSELNETLICEHKTNSWNTSSSGRRGNATSDTTDKRVKVKLQMVEYKCPNITIFI